MELFLAYLLSFIVLFFIVIFIVVEPIAFYKGYKGKMDRIRSEQLYHSFHEYLDYIKQQNPHILCDEQIEDDLFDDTDVGIAFSEVVMFKNKLYTLTYDQYSKMYDMLSDKYDKNKIRSKNIDKVLESDLE